MTCRGRSRSAARCRRRPRPPTARRPRRPATRGAFAGRDPLHDLVRAGIDLRDVAPVAVGHPQRAGAERERSRARRRPGSSRPARARAIDPRDGPVELVRDPHRAAAGGRRRPGCGRPGTASVMRPPSGSITPDGVLVDARRALGLEHADDARTPRCRRGPGRRPRRPAACAGAGAVRGASAGAGSGAAGRSSAGSCARIASCSRRSSAPGSTPICLDQRGARLAVGGQRLGLAAGAVQREHALGVQALAQRMRGDQRVELADHLGVAARREVGVDRALGRAQPQLLEPADLGGRERLVGDVGERVAAPQRERLARRATRSSSRSKRTASTSPSVSCSS